MAALPSIAASTKKIASAIMARIENIKIIYDAILKAAEISYFKIYESRNAGFIQRATTTFLLPSSQLRDKQYDTRVAEQSKDYTVRYEPQDITVVGGAALNIYDATLHPFKMRHHIGQLEQYIKKTTADMDMVWWPTITSKFEENWIVVSSSPAIQLAVTMFEKELTSYLNAPAISNAFIAMFGPTLYEYGQLTECTVEVENLPEPLAGISNISLSFHLSFNGGEPIILYKLCEIAIHDGGASQRYDEKGQEIKTLQPMQQDPVYCTEEENTAPLIFKKSKIPKSTDAILVPSMLPFIKQQVFAFGNHIRSDKKDAAVKAFVHYKRIMYLRTLLNTFDLSAHSNVESFRIIRNKRRPALSNPAYLSKLKEQVDGMVERSLIRFQPRIKEACRLHGDQHDPIVNQLCEIMQFTPTSNDDELQIIQKEIKELEDYVSKMRDIGFLEQEPRKKNARMQKYHLVGTIHTEFKDKCLQIGNSVSKGIHKLTEEVSKNTLETDASTLYVGTKLNHILFDYEILLENLYYVSGVLKHKYTIASNQLLKHQYGMLITQMTLFIKKIEDAIAPYNDVSSRFAYMEVFEPILLLIQKNELYHRLEEGKEQLYKGFNILVSASLGSRDPASTITEWMQSGMSTLVV